MLVEAYMYAVGGLLLGLLLAVFALPLVHDRSKRLTAARIELATPVLATEMRADKDQLRAQFALVTSRLESSIESLKHKSGYLRAELSKREAENKRLRDRLDDCAARTIAAEAAERALREQLRIADDEIEYKSTEMHAMRRDLSDKVATFDRLHSDLKSASLAAAERLAELTVLRATIASLKERDSLFKSVMERSEILRAQSRHSETARTEALRFTNWHYMNGHASPENGNGSHAAGGADIPGIAGSSVANHPDPVTGK